MSSTATSETLLAGVPLAIRVDARARRLRLRLDSRAGRLVLTIPRSVSRRWALAWAAGQEEWARGVLGKRPQPLPFAPDAVFPWRGEDVTIRWSADAARRVVFDDGVLVVGGAADSLAARILRWCKAEARALLEAETREIAALAGVTIAGVGIGDPRSRWGSCSTSGRINYSWRLALAPDFVRRAVVAHEVAHRTHMHHQPAFHALVAQLLGSDPAPAMAWLRRHGAALHRVGGQ